MENLTCSCGCFIYVFHNVLEGKIEFIYDDPDSLITHCPDCGEELSLDNLRAIELAAKN